MTDRLTSAARGIPDQFAVADDECDLNLRFAGSVPGPRVSQVGETQMRQKKLEAIRRAVEAGEYDSDEILEVALGKLIQSIENADETAPPANGAADEDDRPAPPSP